MKHLKKFKIYESPDNIKYKGDGYVKNLHYMNEDAIPFGYYKYTDKFLIGEPGKSHGDMSIKIDGDPMGRMSMNYSGRLWLSEQVMSFWDYPDPKKLKEIINNLESHLDISMAPDDFWGEWQIEVMSENGKVCTDLKDDELDGVNLKSTIIPISQYEDFYNGIQKTNPDIKKKTHLMKPEEREKYWKGKKTDFGSELKTKKNPIWWEQAKRTFENMKHLKNNNTSKSLSYEEYLILEGRISDLETKFKKDLGEGLGEVIFDIDNTENKAYAEWLLKFIKTNREDLEISDELNKPRKEQDKDKWLKDTKTIERLELMLRKYHNNKKEIDTPITKIKTIQQLGNVLDKKDKFDELETDFEEDEVKIFYNSFEWLVFQPFTYEASEYANRKDRKSNWCTTYEESYFGTYGGPKGGLLYCTNKLDSTKDIAFQLKPNDEIIVWNYKDNDINTLYSLYEIKNEFDSDEDKEIYDVLDEVEHEIEIPYISDEELRQETINWYDSLGGFEEIGVNIDVYLEMLDDTNYLQGFIDNKVDYFHTQLASDFFPSYDDQLDFTFQYIWRNCSIKFEEYFDIPHEYGKFWVQDGRTDIDDFIKALQNPERLENLDYEPDTPYSTEDCYKELEEFFQTNYSAYDFVKYYFNERYSGYSAEDIIHEIYGDPHKMEISELTDIGGNYVDYVDYVDKIVSQMDRSEMLDLVYG